MSVGAPAALVGHGVVPHGAGRALDARHVPAAPAIVVGVGVRDVAGASCIGNRESLI